MDPHEAPSDSVDPDVAGVPQIVLLTLPDCGSRAAADALLQEVVAELAPAAPIRRLEVESEAHGRECGFRGSPTILVDGVDLEAGAVGVGGFSGRTYEGAGVPPRWMVEAAILRALAPRSYLFLCVANSARSQLAEGLARSLAPAGTTVASAGSEPSHVRPEAMEVLAEQGIDLTSHRSKSVNDIPARGVEAVITLCAEEVCPVWLGRAHRVHWGLPDPAAVEGDGRLDAFRAARDELRRRLTLLLMPDH